MELEIHERNDDGLILTSFAGASYGYLWETEVEIGRASCRERV